MKTKVLIPSARTLAKYGLSKAEWKLILKRQGGVCAICGKVPQSGRLVTDHDHVPKWKLLPPASRARAVRGILCSMCNFRFLPRGATPKILRAAAQYLEDYESRKVL